ncbi:MAG: hypothetical protein WC178_01180 [Candidatus Paceibacterota bacterium]
MEESVIKKQNNGIKDANEKQDFFAITKDCKSWRVKLKTMLIFLLILLSWFVVIQYITAEKYVAIVNVLGENEQISAGENKDLIDYGNLPKGSSSTRFITISNSGNSDIYIKILKIGGIGKLIKVNRNDFFLRSKEIEKLEFSVETEADTKEKEYTGKVIIFKIPKIL